MSAVPMLLRLGRSGAEVEVALVGMLLEAVAVAEASRRMIGVEESRLVLSAMHVGDVMSFGLAVWLAKLLGGACSGMVVVSEWFEQSRTIIIVEPSS